MSYEFHKRMPVFVCRVCSQCGSPVVMRSTVYTHVENGSALASDMIPEKAAVAAAKAVGALLGGAKEIALPDFMRGHYPDRCGFNVSCTVQLQNADAPCPHCGKLEKWQDFKNKENPAAAEAPVFFDREEEACAWAYERILDKQRALQLSAVDPEELVAALNETAGKISACEAEVNRLMDLDGIPEISEIKKRKKELKAAVSELGMFKAKEKKVLNTELEALEAKEKDLMNTLKEQRLKLGRDYRELSDRLEDFLLLSGGQDIVDESLNTRKNPVQASYKEADAFVLTSKGYYGSAMKLCPACKYFSPRIARYCGSCGKKFE